MIRLISLHPQVHGDAGFALPAGRSLSSGQRKLLSRARAAVVPQSIREAAWAECLALCPRIFPDYHCRFGWEGKRGNHRLFASLGLPHPATRSFASVAEFARLHPPGAPLPLAFPLVVKADQGGGGFCVFLVRNPDGFCAALSALKAREAAGEPGFVVQEYVDHGGRDLRVVLVGKRMIPYWRVQDNPAEFRNNLGRGARIEPRGDPVLTARGLDAAKALRQRSGINLAAVDILFRPGGDPLLSEVNFVFGRKGVGGTPRFRSILREEVEQWIAGLSP
ncbi:MAG: glutathione synthase [Proteobacteria bacterium]|nr:glutathione synthase [Pseudomonadota bacterium]